MALTQEPSVIVTDPRRYLTSVHGIAGVGKTSFGKQIPGHYFMCTESGTAGVSIFGDPILTWEEFTTKCAEVVTTKNRGWKDPEGNDQREITTFVIDTYEMLYALAAKWICVNCTFPEKGVHQKFDRIEDVPYGKGYKRTNELVIEKLNKLLLLGFGVLTLSHSKERDVKWRGQTLKSYGPNLPPSAAQGLIDASDAVSYFYTEESISKDEEGHVVQVEEGRYMKWQSSFLIAAKHRLKGFPDILPLPIDQGYQTYLEAFNETLAKLT